MELTNYILLPAGGYPFGVEAGPTPTAEAELHGGFPTSRDADEYAAELRAEFSDYEYVKVVQIGTRQGYDRQFITAIEAAIAEAEKKREDDDDAWASAGVGQDTEEAETSGHLVGYHEGLQAALALYRDPTGAGVAA